MAFCRWSSDDWNSDVYVYENVFGGYDLMVAARRYVGDIPKMPPAPREDAPNEEWTAFTQIHYDQLQSLKNCKLVDINGPFDEAIFNFRTIPELIEKLEELKEAEYRVPDFLIPLLREELEGELH